MDKSDKYNKINTDPDISNSNSVLLENMPDRLEQPSPFHHEDPKVIDTKGIKRDALETRHKFAYSIGHLSNDLCAAGWFFNFTFYLKYVVLMPGGDAGLVMLAGQVADGITTPIVGLLSDRCKTPIGSRAPFYILGTLIVIPCFLGIFLSPFGVKLTTITGSQMGYYIALASIFNVGWASVQIANMSVVNSITYSP